MINSSRSSSLAAIVSAVRSVLADKDIPANDGLMKLLDIRLPKGSILDPDPGKPVRARIEASYRAADAVYAALAQAIPERVPSEGYNSTTGLYLVQNTPQGRTRIYGDVLGGGYGAGARYDGAHALAGILSSSRNTPIEAIEQIHPHIRMRHYRLVQDSAGAGQWRGGLGFSRAIEVLEDEVTLSFYSDHFRFAPRGRNGGTDGGTGSLKVYRGNELLEFPATAVVPLRKGDVVELSVGGGAGWGNPAERAADAIADDLADGIISPDYARRHYPTISV
jgi:N-methylhydantoinase B